MISFKFCRQRLLNVMSTDQADQWRWDWLYIPQ